MFTWFNTLGKTLSFSYIKNQHTRRHVWIRMKNLFVPQPLLLIGNENKLDGQIEVSFWRGHFFFKWFHSVLNSLLELPQVDYSRGLALRVHPPLHLQLHLHLWANQRQVHAGKVPPFTHNKVEMLCFIRSSIHCAIFLIISSKRQNGPRWILCPPQCWTKWMFLCRLEVYLALLFKCLV